MKPHFLQSSAWEKYQKLEGKTTFRLKEKNFEAMAILETTPLGNYLYCPYGPTLNPKIDQKKALSEALGGLENLAKKQKAFFVRIEPTIALNTPEAPKNTDSLSVSDFKQLGLKKSHDLNPAHTWVVDLTQPEDELLKNMGKSKKRYYRANLKNGTVIRQSKDPEEISILTTMLKEVSAKNHFSPQTSSRLKNQLKSDFSTLYIAEKDGTPLAATLVYDDKDSRFYAHVATSDEGKKIEAGLALSVQMILDAKKKGAKNFDFWGVTTSQDKNHPWYGFSKYKMSFGGSLVTYAGTWDFPINKSRYSLYRIIRKLNRLKRKFLH